ncbi:MAG: hypothetical protein R1F52_06045 [Candidatus Nitrosoabyssus spongiisocia]|nr:MAG: hypothetical protein R1F52_06045 [Nitrosopumilaceae archaeon AB1(1)]
MFKIFGFLLIFICSISVYGSYSSLLDDAYDFHTNSQWYLGMNLNVGDTYHYRICDYTFDVPNTIPYCYELVLDVLVRYDDDSLLILGDVESDSNISNSLLFTFSETGTFKTLLIKDRLYGFSIQNTILYLNNFATPSSPKSLNVGNSFGTVDSPFGDVDIVVSKHIRGNHMTDGYYQLDLDLATHSMFWLDPNLPFPIYAIAYNPHDINTEYPLYEYTLLNHSSLSSNYTINYLDDSNYHDTILNSITQESVHSIPSQIPSNDAYLQGYTTKF